MYSAKENLPIKLELPGVTIRSTPWNGMAALYVQLAKGSDFTPVLKGLPDDLCSVRIGATSSKARCIFAIRMDARRLPA